jgi:membrane protein
VLASIIGTVALLFGALGVFAELQDSLNTIWEVKPKPQGGLIGTLKNLFLKRLLSFAMLAVIGFILLASLALSAGLAALNEWLAGMLPLPEFVMLAINFVISFGVITVLFASIFKILPDAKIAWRDVWLGAAVTSLLFTIGKLLIGLYLGNSNIGTSFGAAGALALLLIWVYYSAQIVFFGAEFTQVYANEYGSRIRPDEDAVRVTEEERAQQGLARRDRPGEYQGQAGGVWALQAMQRSRTYPDRQYREKSALDKAFFSLLLITQFIPALRSLYATKTK